MNQMTLGEAIRSMVKAAIRDENNFVEVDLVDLLCATKGVSRMDLSPDQGDNPRYHLPKLKNSYIVTTSARMPELQDANLKVKANFKSYGLHEYTNQEVLHDKATGTNEVLGENTHPLAYKNGTDVLQIQLVKGAVKLGSRGPNDLGKQNEKQKIQNEFAAELIERIKSLAVPVEDYASDAEIMKAAVLSSAAMKALAVKAIEELNSK